MPNEFENDAMVRGVSGAASSTVDSPADRDGPVGGDAPADAFQAALDEYGEDAPAPKEAPEPQSLEEYFAHARSMGFSDDEARSLMPPEFRTQEELNKARDALSNNYSRSLAHLQQVAQQINAERDRQDAQRLFDSMRRDFPDLSERMVKALLTDKYHTDERTASAWHNRYGNKASWAREVDRIKAELAAETARPIDHEQTDTRAAVAAWMTRGSGGSRREPVAADTTSMTDAEYKQHVKTEFGYTPKVG